MSLDNTRLLDFLGELDKELNRKIIVVAAGGTALTLLKAKTSTIDVDFTIPSKYYDELESVLKTVPHGFRVDLYHDGRVVVAGSTGHNWVSAVFAPTKNFEHDIEIITPPYLSGNPARPQIDAIPSSIQYNTNFEVMTNDAQNIQQVSLIRASSTTHNNNMDQRCLMLSIVHRTDNALKLSSPKDNSWAPPGYYMLFLVDNMVSPL